MQPAFLVDYPVEMSPLAKASPDDPRYTERFEAFAAGMEIANSFTELNDPDVQHDRLAGQEELRKQYQGEELDRMDEDFLTALEHGMPPNRRARHRHRPARHDPHRPRRTIRDVMLFPQVRHTGEADA